MINIITDEVRSLCIATAVSSTRVPQDQHLGRAAGTASNFTVLGAGGPRLFAEDNESTDDAEGVGMGADTVDGAVDAVDGAHGVSEVVDGACGVLVVMDGQTNPRVGVDKEVEGDRVSVKPNLNTTHTHTNHPTMVKRGVRDSMDDGDVLCAYTDGVCATHGPATKKWRGGRVWGKKKNGLFGWKYDRKTYWICEKKRGDLPGVGTEKEEPTFILMGTSKSRLTPSNVNTTGGNSKRFSDLGSGARTRRAGQ